MSPPQGWYWTFFPSPRKLSTGTGRLLINKYPFTALGLDYVYVFISITGLIIE